LTADQTRQSSDRMSELVRKIAMANSMDFIDARPMLRSAAAASLIHGPKDWDHLNETGYRVLGRLVASRVEARPSN
jgi:hypothetical protein